MRTPGRCTNIEGCWIGASRRDVWAPVGDDFVCPNCGNGLVPPERGRISMRGLRRAALLGALLLVVLAGGSLAAIRLTPLAVAAARPVLAAIFKAPRALMAGDLFGQRSKPDAAARGAPLRDRAMEHSPAAPRVSSEAPWARPAVVALGPGAPQAGAPTGQWVRGPSAAAVVLYSAAPVAAGSRPHGAAMTHAVTTTADDGAGRHRPAPAALVTPLAEATLVVPPTALAPVVLPVTFGRPVAPENDAEPIRLHWRYHGLIAPRRSVFRRAPRDDIEAMCRTLEPLQ